MKERLFHRFATWRGWHDARELLRRFPRRFLLPGAALALVLALVLSAILWESSASRPVSTHGRPQVFRVERGQGASGVATALARRHLIRSAFYFRMLADVSGKGGALEAGVYLLSPMMSTERILTLLTEGRVAVHRVTLPEGSTVREIAARMAKAGVVSESAFLRAASALRNPYLAPGAKVLQPSEGILFPDTYEIPYGTRADAVVGLLYATFRKNVPDALLARGAKEGLSPGQVLILASIVEKEAKFKKDQPLVASVFLNRIRKKMPLGSDTTLDYALGVPNDQLTAKDIASKSPYNTFHRPGFPPGPIDCPGLQAIEAVLDAAKTPYLYFYSLPSGQEIFSKTYTQQEAVIRKYRKTP